MAWSCKTNPEKTALFLDLVSTLGPIQSPLSGPWAQASRSVAFWNAITVRKRRWWTMLWLGNLLHDVTCITCSHMSLDKACDTATPRFNRVGYVILLQGRAWQRGTDDVACLKSERQMSGGQRKKLGEVQVWWQVTRNQDCRRKEASESFQCRVPKRAGRSHLHLYSICLLCYNLLLILEHLSPTHT